MGFKNYCNEHKNNPEDAGKQVESLYNTYKGKTEDELLEELIKHVAKQKQNGTYDYDSLQSLISKITPYLTNEQKAKLNEVLKQIQ